MIDPLLPMLATSAAPFDSSDYFFEVKWDGVRALAAVEGADSGFALRDHRLHAIPRRRPQFTGGQ